MRAWLEIRQSWIYLLCIIAGLLLGLSQPATAARFDVAVWPLLAVLLYTTFTQIPFTQIGHGLKDWRFLGALLLGNFVVIPLFVGALTTLFVLSPAVQAGVLLVLLVPCTDWFISFTHQGKGDGARAVAATPVLLLMQLVLLPMYLWLFLGSDWLLETLNTRLLGAFLGLILAPLILAWMTEQLAQRNRIARQSIELLSYLPVPLLALVVLVIAASQVKSVALLGAVWIQLLLIFLVYLVFAAYLGRILGRVFDLPSSITRTLCFSFGTRNSFVMLPIALTLPPAWQGVATIVIFQSLIELFGMVAYLKWVPERLVPQAIRSGPS
ncbi:arsenic resistance protein [Orrella marina]|uniref:Bile acid:sodium symporter n=1 Tax=Orrella marina TaxID=2163011 RepID=A0A2R4XHG6_9BURK|nr:arsenic resistance protein [Orrella marina]AWB33268.1 bile acid:sodium symporter [Orrella marina]